MQPVHRPLWELSFKDAAWKFKGFGMPPSEFIADASASMEDLERLRRGCLDLRNRCEESLNDKSLGSGEKLSRVTRYYQELDELLQFYKNLMDKMDEGGT